MEMCTLFALCYISSFVLPLTRYRCTTVWAGNIFVESIGTAWCVCVIFFSFSFSISFSPFRSIGRLLFNTCQNPSCKALNFVFFFSLARYNLYFHMYIGSINDSNQKQVRSREPRKKKVQTQFYIGIVTFFFSAHFLPPSRQFTSI